MDTGHSKASLADAFYHLKLTPPKVRKKAGSVHRNAVGTKPLRFQGYAFSKIDPQFICFFSALYLSNCSLARDVDRTACLKCCVAKGIDRKKLCFHFVNFGQLLTFREGRSAIGRSLPTVFSEPARRLLKEKAQW